MILKVFANNYNKPFLDELPRQTVTSKKDQRYLKKRKLLVHAFLLLCLFAGLSAHMSHMLSDSHHDASCTQIAV